MPYIRRTDGKISGTYNQAQIEGQERLPDDNAEVVAFLNPPPVPDRYDDLLDAVGDAVKSSDTTKLDVLLAKRAK